MKSLKFDVFGRLLQVVATESGWQAFYAGDDGKRRPARDIVIPDGLEESDIERYLDDLCHEWASDKNNRVRRID